MRTNFQMIKDLYTKFQPVQRGILTGDEMNMIKEELSLSGMDVIQLRNLRDFIVLYFSMQIDKTNQSIEEVMKNMDMCSGICAVIDEEIFGKGGEI